MKYIGISKTSKRYKGNLHCHSTNSDGTLSPQELKELYKSNAYSFLAITDHEIYSDFSAELNDEDFILIPGIEASVNLVSTAGKSKGHRLKTHHILGLLGTKAMQENASKQTFKHLENIHPETFYDVWDGLATAQKLVNSLHERGLAVTYNHPRWSRVDYNDFANLENIFALEVYNYGTEIECGLGEDLMHWDEMLTQGKNINAFASDDNHNSPSLPDSLGGAIVVCPMDSNEKLNHENLMQNILDGHYYSTSGVDIFEWGIEDNKVYVYCSDVNRIHFIVGGCVNGGYTEFCQNKDNTITHATYTLKGFESYVRIECIDKYGRKAWTNPFYFK